MNKKQLKDLVIYLTENGGATLNANGKIMNLTCGYCVSLDGYESKTSLESINLQVINDHLQLAKKLKAYCGLWIDNNQLYIDISMIMIGTMMYSSQTYAGMVPLNN